MPSQIVDELARLAEQASPEAVELARMLLEQSIADAEWAAQIGPALSQRDVGRLLGKSEQAVSKDSRLLRVRNRDGRPVYPVLQFDGRAQLAGVADVITTLRPAFAPLNIASWLTSINHDLGGRRPVDALRTGDLDDVLPLARRLAADAG